MSGAWAQPSAEALEWVAGDLPPFAWMSPSGPQGFAHDLAIAMAARLGRPQTVAYYPWARAVKLVEEGTHYGIFPLTRTADREARFRWLIPLMVVPQAFVWRRAAKPMELPELRPLRVGLLRGSPWVKMLRDRQFDHLVEGKDYRELLRLLDTDAIQLIFAGEPMLHAAMDEYGYSRAHFTTHLRLGEATIYMGASAQLSDEEADRWVKAYRELEADGTVARLRKHYFP